MLRTTALPLAAAVLFSLSIPSLAQTRKQAPPQQTKGQGQMAGGSGQFGVVYTVKGGFNLEILSAKYTVEPFESYYSAGAKTDGKLLVIDFAIKNVTPKDNYFGTDHFITAVDTAGQLYTTSNVSLASHGIRNFDTNLRPGQGMGQPALHDPLRVAIQLPEKARIVKFMMRDGRVFPKEDTFRYYIAGSTKEEAGEAGNPKNVIAPLPDNIRDPADPSGSTPLAEGKGVMGQVVPSGIFGLRLDGFSYSADNPKGRETPKRRRYAIATVTAKVLAYSAHGGKPTDSDIEPNELLILTDTDGEKYQPRISGSAGGPYLKAKRPEPTDFKFDPGDEYTYRIVWEIPTDAVAKKIDLAARNGRKWAYDVSNLK